jgi:hypothetical protein
MTSTKFWFLLLDSATGQPFKGTTADFVSLPPGADVADFRKLAYREHSNKLASASVDAADLFVYRNKAAFDQRKVTAVDEGKEEPLKASRNLDGLGETEEDALIVVVPSLLSPSIQPSQQIQPLSFPPCRVPFFNNIGSIAENDGGWISFGQENIPSTKLGNLYIRDCYRTIAASITDRNGIQKAIITGTPGIGKSLFLIYLLWQLVKKRQRVLFIYHPFSIYYDENGDVLQFESGRLPSDIDYSFWNDTLWCLFDAKFKEEADLGHLPVGLSTFILSTSPRRGMVNDFKKPPVPQTFYMPIWTETELAVIAPLFPNSDNEWRERFRILGGIPRHVLEDTKDSPTAILGAACKKCSLDNCIEEIGIDSAITDKSKVIHSLVHITSAPPFETSSVCYASQAALNIIVQHKEQKARLRMRDLLASCEGNPLTAALCGYIFEQYAIELLEKGGEFPCRQLFHGNKKIKPDDMTLQLQSSNKIVADRVMHNQTLNQLYVPKTKNYTAIDAWIPGVGAFQITISEKHGIKGQAEDDLAKLGGGNKLYWLLPPSHYPSFTKKSPHSIEQYAVKIPFPE